MNSIPLSTTRIDAHALSEILGNYESQPVMKIVNDFEEVIQKYTGSKHVLALNSGTAAIHLALKALGVREGDFVIAPTFTYVATVNPILYLGANPVFVDSEPVSWNMDPELLEGAIKDCISRNRKPKCVIVVHGYGMPARITELGAICKQYEIPILEDAAEALGATYFQRPAGTIGDIGIFSFNNNKIVTSYGGGALVTQNDEIYRKCLFWASQSREDKPFYEHTELGFNYRMSPLNAAAGLLGMKSISERVAARRGVFDSYKYLLGKSNLQFSFVKEPEGFYSNCWLSTFTFESVDINRLALKLNAQGIECRRLWNPMHLQPIFANASAVLSGVSETLFERGICLPSGNDISQSQQEFVISSIAKFSR